MTVPQFLPPVPNSQTREDGLEKRRLRKNRKSRARHRKIAKMTKAVKRQWAAHERWLQYAYGGGM